MITAKPKTEEVRVNIPREEETPRRMYLTKATVEKYGKNKQECYKRLRSEMSQSEEWRRR